MSEHPDWQQFKSDEEHQAYLADLDTWRDEKDGSEVRIIINGLDSYDMPITEEEWKAVLAQYEIMEEEGVDD